MATREYRTGLAFPASYGETIIVRDGRGRTVEAWTVVGIDDGKKHRFITFEQGGYRKAGTL